MNNMETISGQERAYLERTIRRLRDFQVSGGQNCNGQDIFYDFTDDGHRLLVNSIARINNFDRHILSYSEVCVFEDDEITPDILDNSKLTIDDLCFDFLSDDDDNCYQDDDVTPQQIADFLKANSPDIKQSESKHFVVGVEKDFLDNAVIYKQPLRIGYKINSVDIQRLEPFCKLYKVQLYDSELGEGSLSRIDIDESTVNFTITIIATGERITLPAAKSDDVREIVKYLFSSKSGGTCKLEFAQNKSGLLLPQTIKAGKKFSDIFRGSSVSGVLKPFFTITPGETTLRETAHLTDEQVVELRQKAIKS